MDKLIKVRDFVARTGVPVGNVHRWFHQGVIRGVQPGGHKRLIMIFESEVDRLLGSSRPSKRGLGDQQ